MGRQAGIGRAQGDPAEGCGGQETGVVEAGAGPVCDSGRLMQRAPIRSQELDGLEEALIACPTILERGPGIPLAPSEERVAHFVREDVRALDGLAPQDAFQNGRQAQGEWDLPVVWQF